MSWIFPKNLVPEAVDHQVLLLVIAGLIAFFAVCRCLARLRRNQRVDLFHPLIFPTAYVAIATLGPALWIYGKRSNLGYITSDQLSERTALLLALAVIGFVIGAAVPFERRAQVVSAIDRATLTQIGRVLLLFPLTMALIDLSQNTVLTRGQNQAEITAADSLGSGALIVAPAAVLLILSGRMRKPRLIGAVDWALIGTTVIVSGLNGRRAGAIAIMLVVIMFVAARGFAGIRLALGLGTVVVFTNTILEYRTTAVGEVVELSFVESALRDLGSVAFTTGLTDRLQTSHLYGATLIDSLIRQLPSPIAIPLFGPPTGTGNVRFRDLAGSNSDNGYGFSVPAEGVMNFGILGAFILPFVVGLTLAWLYARSDLTGARPIGWVYSIAVAALPFSWRSDMLGTVKGLLYPFILFTLAVILSRTVYKPGSTDLLGGLSTCERENARLVRENWTYHSSHLPEKKGIPYVSGWVGAGGSEQVRRLM